MNNVLIINFDKENPHAHYSNISNGLPDVKRFLVDNATPYTQDVREFVDMERDGGRECQYFEYSKAIPTGRLFMDLFTWAMNDLSIGALAYSDNKNTTGAILKLGFDLIKEQKCVAFGSVPEKVTQTFEFQGHWLVQATQISTPFVLNMDIFRQATRSIVVFNSINTAMQNAFPFDGEANFELFFSELNKSFGPLTKPHAPILGF